MFELHNKLTTLGGPNHKNYPYNITATTGKVYEIYMFILFVALLTARFNFLFNIEYIYGLYGIRITYMYTQVFVINFLCYLRCN